MTDAVGALAARALNLINSGVIVLDAGHEIVLWNGWMVPRSGLSAQRVLGRTLWDVFPELRGSRVESAVMAALLNNSAATLAASQHRAPFPLRQAGSFDGPRIDQAVTVTPFADAGACFCVLEIRDVSGIQDRERQLLDHAEALRAQSYLDGLTRIANRRYFDVALQRELRRARRHGTPLALLLMDIDHFKAYNDHFGHPQGDTCLAAVARAIAAMLKRPADVAARYGGEEFAAILPDTGAVQAEAHAQAIRARVAALALAQAPGAARPLVSLSIGVACVVPGGQTSTAALIAAADAALYAAKHAGRDCVRVAADAAPP